MMREVVIKTAYDELVGCSAVTIVDKDELMVVDSGEVRQKGMMYS
jgi:hypothetical protein